jgi:hypothetical protein
MQIFLIRDNKSNLLRRIIVDLSIAFNIRFMGIRAVSLESVLIAYSIMIVRLYCYTRKSKRPHSSYKDASQPLLQL